jgi:hypothetical protein
MCRFRGRRLGRFGGIYDLGLRGYKRLLNYCIRYDSHMDRNEERCQGSFLFACTLPAIEKSGSIHYLHHVTVATRYYQEYPQRPRIPQIPES